MNHNTNIELVIIGGSAGSLQVILDMIKKLDNNLSFSILLVLHRKAKTSSVLPVLLQQFSPIEVIEIEDKTDFEKNKIYIVPADYHLLFDNKLKMSLDVSEKINYSRPSIDVSFQSAARIFRDALVGILLSGANADGVEGLDYIYKNGGLVWIQNPETAEVEYMPRHALDAVTYHSVFNSEELAAKINQLNKT
ncbi:chemotaxis protein CheB [Chryseobacterium sp. T1]